MEREFECSPSQQQCGLAAISTQPSNQSSFLETMLRPACVATGPLSKSFEENLSSNINPCNAAVASEPQRRHGMCSSLSAPEPSRISRPLDQSTHATATSEENHRFSNPSAECGSLSLQEACRKLLDEIVIKPCAATHGLQEKLEAVYDAFQDSDRWPDIPDELTWRHVWVLNAAYYEFVLFQEFDKARQLLKDMLSNNNVIVVLFVTIVYTAAVNPANGVSALLGAKVNNPGSNTYNTTSIEFTYDGFNPVSAIVLIMYTLGYALALMSIVGGIGVIFLLGPIWSFDNFRDSNPMWGSLLHMSVLAFMFSMYVFLGAYGVSVWQLYATSSFAVAVAVLMLVYSMTMLVQWSFVEVLTYKMSGLYARITQQQLKDQYMLKLAGKAWPQDMDIILQVVTGAMKMCETLEWLKRDPNTALDKFFDSFVFYRATVLHTPEKTNKSWLGKLNATVRGLVNRMQPSQKGSGSSHFQGPTSFGTQHIAGTSHSV